MITGTKSQLQSCPVIGDDRSSADFSARTRARPYMNVDAPSQCNGTVIGWNYCYYRTGSSGNRLGARFLVYRQSHTAAGVYEQVPNSIYTLVLDYDDLTSRGCNNITLNKNEQFQILKNDIVSVCIFSNSTIKPLYITAASSGQNSYEVNVSDYQMCRVDQLSSIDTNQLRDSGDFIRRFTSLLLNAIIISKFQIHESACFFSWMG